MAQDTENRNRPLALILTIIYHGLLLLLFLLIIFKTPIPPYPTVGGGGGLEVNFGTSANGMGNVQPEQYIPIDIKVMNQQTRQSTKVSGENEDVLTQQTEEAPAIKTGVVNKKKKKKNEILNEKETRKTTEIQINYPVINPLALYKKKPKAASEGETGQPGDQGSPNGTMNSKNHYGEGGSGGGTGGGIGTGNGTGIGSGSGAGTGTLRGVSYSLSGRKQRYLPKPPSITLQHQEIVVVTIWVDRTGNVTRVNVGEKGTTATDQRLFKIAEEYASKSKFDSNPQAKEVQKGNITYIFTPSSE